MFNISTGAYMFGVKIADIENLVRTNYFLIVVEGLFMYILARYNILPMGVVYFGVGSILGATLLLHLFLKFKAKTLTLELGTLFCSLVVLATIAVCIYFFSPAIKPTTLLIFIPAIILSASLSLSFGVTYLVIVAIAIFSLYLLGIHNVPELFDGTVKFQFIFNSFFILVLGSLASLFFEILRKKEKKIAELYQMSKTTSDEIVKNMKDALVVVDANFKVVRHNQAFSKIAGPEDLVNADFKSIILPFELDLVTLTKYILDNDIASTISVSAEDKSENKYQTSIKKIGLENKTSGFLLMIHIKLSPWGIVFDSATKAPVDFAIVRLVDPEYKKIKETRVTDSEGHFGFMVPEGAYTLLVTKEGYTFPSKVGTGYRGEEFSSAGEFVKMDIPIDKISSS